MKLLQAADYTSREFLKISDVIEASSRTET